LKTILKTLSIASFLKEDLKR